MANETQQVLIEFVTSTAGLDPAVDKLVQLGVVEKSVGDQFKKTNEEINKQATAVNNAGKASQTSATGTKKSIDDLDKAVKTLTNDFILGFGEGVADALKEAGVSMDEFQAAIAGTDTTTKKFTERIADLKKRLDVSKEANSFQGLQKQVSEARQRVLQTATALERLRKTGGVDTEKFDELNETLKQQQAELKSVEDQYDAVIASSENYGKVTEDVTETVRQRLKEIQSELVRMRVAGEHATDPERYQALTEEAGQLSSALGDVADEVARAGSNTGALDSLLQVAGGITGGFAAAQGAVGLFTDENEALQEVLLRVNSAMAILQGLQQIQAVYAARAAVATGLQTVAQTAFNVVVGNSVGLLRVLRIALAASVVWLLIFGFIELVKWLNSTSKQIKQLIADMQRINAEFENATRILDEYSETLRRNSNEDIATLEANNTLASEISKQRINDAQAELVAVLELEKQRRAQFELSKKALIEFNRLREEGDAIVNKESFKQLEAEHLKYVQAFEALEKRRLDAAAAIREQQVAREKQLNEEALRSQIATTERALSLSREGSRAQLELQQKLVRDKLALDLQTQALTEAQRLQLIEQSNRDQLELRLAFNKRLIDQDIARIEESLRGVEVGTIAELRLRQELLQRQAAAEVQTTRLSEAEKMQIRQNAANEVVRIELAFAAEQRQIADQQRRQVREDFIQAAMDRNAAALSLAEQGSEQQLQLQLANIELSATNERNVAQGNAIRIAAINAEAERQKLEVKRAFAEAAAESEIRIETAKNGRLVRGLQATLADQRSTFRQRVSAINELFLIEANAIDKQKQNLRGLFKAGLIGQQEYNTKYAELEDQRLAISEQTEDAILAATKARTLGQIQASIEVASQLIGVLDTIYQGQSDREQQRIEEQRARIDDLRESGAITEKEAERRRKQLEIEERKAQQRQAQREKQIADFRALLAIPQAFLQGLVQGGPILGAIYAAIAGVQAALVFSQPIPKFGTGKKNSYEGLAEIGETGAELVESGGQMYVAPKRTIVWLGARDKVYNPKETASMLQKKDIRAARLPQGMGVQVAPGISFDYERLGKEIARNQKDVNLNIDGYKNFVINGHQFTTYLNSRRGY